MDLLTRYPKYKDCQAALGQYPNISKVSSTAWSGYVYPDGDFFTKPDFTKIEERLKDAGNDIHIHPIIARHTQETWDKQEPYLEEMCYRVLDQYAHRFTRWTIANELLVKQGPRIVQLYENIAERYPHLELWVGEYGLNSKHVTSGIVPWVYELKAAIPSFKGIVLVDYLDLRPTAQTNQIKQAIERFIPLTRDRVQAAKPESMPDWLSLLSESLENAGADLVSRLKLAGLGKLERNLGKVVETGVQVALETSVFVGSEPSEKTLARQVIAYQLLVELCQGQGINLWHWNIFDKDLGAAWLGSETDHAGWFDGDNQMKDWAINFIDRFA